MLPYISDCMIHVTLSDLITLLYQPNPLNTVLSNETQDLLKSFGTMSQYSIISLYIVLHVIYRTSFVCL